jgi:tRNA(Ile)-lysidine synthase
MVGVSGGPDSLCLVDILLRLEGPVIIAHLNHKLRPEGDMEAEKVRNFADQCQVPFVLGVEDVRVYSEKHSLSIEEAARDVRYAFLFKQAKMHKAKAVAVGHNADDQVETVLMHLLRGAGLSGLRGMVYRMVPNPWSEEIPLIRPLLGFWRFEIQDYCEKRGLEPAFDRTNLDKTYFRNRLRYELIPILEEYNPAVKKNFLRTAEVLAGDYQELTRLVDTAWNTCMEEQGNGYVAFKSIDLLGQSLPIKRYLMRRAIAQLKPGLRNIDFDDVERGINFLDHPSQSGHLDLKAGIRVMLEDDHLWMAYWDTKLPTSDWPQVESGQKYQLDFPGEVILPERWRIKADLVEDVPSARTGALINQDPYQAWIDRDTIGDQLEIRSRKPGERFKPLGMKRGTIKISEFMINEKLPLRARAAWPLICIGDHVVWIPGLRLGHPFRVKSSTKRVIRMHLFRNPD